MRRTIVTIVVAICAFAAGAVYAQKRHPNLAAAQKDIGLAWEKLLAAQEAHEFDLGGHAQKAKDALDTAQKEVKLAVEAAGK